jgi:hypothetical protein
VFDLCPWPLYGASMNRRRFLLTTLASAVAAPRAAEGIAP